MSSCFRCITSLLWSCALVFVCLSAGAQVSPAPITLPIELIAYRSSTDAYVSVNVPANLITQNHIVSLVMQVHGLSYPNKASVQFNNGSWIPLNNNTVTVASPGDKFGGIGGAFATLKLQLPIRRGALLAGQNRIGFRYNGTDGVSNSVRILNFNFLTDTNALALPATLFQQTDPNTWLPPYPGSASIAAGQKLWRTATLRSSSLGNAFTLKAHCSDCHTQDGRDLKYFNYSNLSIVKRAMFHGLTETAGNQIASYIRTLKTPNPGRPWNPPYQPGPGLDGKPISEWAAGAGLNWVLDKDSDTLPYLFPNGINKSAVATSSTLNLRELPIAFPLPDWNSWLPKVHPKDSMGAAFTNSAFNKLYAGEGTYPSNWNLRYYLSSPQYVDYILKYGFRWDEIVWSGYGDSLILSKIQQVQQTGWSPASSLAVYSIAQWRLVKLWELTQENHLDTYGPAMYGGRSEPRTWFTKYASIPFDTAPHKLGIPLNSNGVGGSALESVYLSNAWYYLQMLLDNGNRQHDQFHPVDWPYAYGLVKDLYQMTGSPEAMRLTAMIVKGMQNTDNGIGPDNPGLGWCPGDIADPSRLLTPTSDILWSGVAPPVKTQILNAILGAWLDKTLQYAPALYFQGYQVNPRASGFNSSPLYIPQGAPNGPLADRTLYSLWLYRANRVDKTLVNRTADWAATMWPRYNWASLKQ